MTGWVKIHRDIMSSTTFQTLTAKQKMIAIYLILNVNWEDGIWTDNKKGTQVKIKRGQMVISPQKIADEWFPHDKEFTRQVVRTALDRLEKLNFLTRQTTTNYTLINIENYNVYQAKENEDNQPSNLSLTYPQPILNLSLTTIKEREELKELKDSNKKIRPKVAPSDADLENAHLLYEKILINLPNYKKPNFVTWGNAFRLLREQDKITNDKEIKFLISFSQEHKFWKKNILSAVSFRDKYNTLYLEAKDAGDKRRHYEQKGISEAEEFVERLKKEKAQKQGAIEIGPN